MCGRFALYTDPNKLAEMFSASLKYDIELSYNIAPSLAIPALIAVGQERWIVPLRWGLIPAWVKEDTKLPLLNNAKSETIDSKPSFRSSFRQRRCLILADGFYEWDAKQTPKQPYFIHRKNHYPIAMAGIWDRWATGEKAVDSCCIITTSANKVVSSIHDRMPVIITPENYDAWLDGSLHDVETLNKLMRNAVASTLLEAHSVSTKVNKANYNNPDCIRPLS
jgi:putative SOS response-associated peptidase YedK